jgi:leader peptidase (prepilin peptidase)/N-methyltransferase
MWAVAGASMRLLLYALYADILGVVLVTDLEARRIPNVVIVPAIAFAAVAAFFTPGLAPRAALSGGLVGLAVYLAIALLGRLLYGSGAMGMGDVKLATFIGLVTGFPLVGVALVVAVLAAGVTSLVLLVTGVRGRRESIPYAPFLVTGAAVAAIWGQPLLRAFLA